MKCYALLASVQKFEVKFSDETAKYKFSRAKRECAEQKANFNA